LPGLFAFCRVSGRRFLRAEVIVLVWREKRARDRIRRLFSRLATVFAMALETQNDERALATRSGTPRCGRRE